MNCKSCNKNIPFDGFNRDLCSKCWNILISAKNKLRQNNKYKLTARENKSINKVLNGLK